MGNGCFCKTSDYIKDINLVSSSQQPIINTKSEQVINKDEETTEKVGQQINNLINYFHESEKEILKNLKKKEKPKKRHSKRKSTRFDLIAENTKYETIVERLLAQQNIKRNGPKRRETIRKDEDIQKMVKDILKENKDNILNKKPEAPAKKESFIIKKNKDLKGRFSVSVPRNGFFFSNLMSSSDK